MSSDHTNTPFLMQHTYPTDTSKTILIVEDHPAIRELLVFTFTLSGYQVVTAEQHASSTWITDGAQMVPDGVVLDLDIRSAAFKGPSDVLQTFCAHWHHVSRSLPPLLLITTQPENQSRFKEEGYLVMTKPFKPPTLLETMNKITEQL